MKCLLKYQWVKLSRAYLPQGKGLMGYWAKLASRAAFRKGHALYCGYKNEVIPGMWSGGIVGLKSILGLKSRAQALEIMNELSALGYISYSLDPKTKKLTYQINDWVVKCSGAECSEGTVYASDGYGFICLPRDITQRLADSNRKFSESDAWLDLWCHTVWQDSGNIFSLLAPTVQFERRKALLTLETMGQRWKWEKTKVWRFFQKYNPITITFENCQVSGNICNCKGLSGADGKFTHIGNYFINTAALFQKESKQKSGIHPGPGGWGINGGQPDSQSFFVYSILHLNKGGCVAGKGE